MNKFILFFLSFFWMQFVMAASVNPQMQEANEAYQANEFEQAIEIYEQLISDGYNTKVLLYNLGNAYYRNGQIGRAILHYERAALIAGKDKDIRHNLTVARQQLQDDIEVLPEFFLARWWHQIRMQLSSGAWTVLGLLFLWGGVAGLVVWLMAASRNRKKMGFLVGIVLLVLSVLPFALAQSRIALLKHSGKAIVLPSEVVLHSAPDPASAEVLKLHEGTKVSLVDQIGDWHKVNLQNGEQGLAQ